MLAGGGLEEEDCSGLGNGKGFTERGGFEEGLTGQGGAEKEMEESSSLLLQSGHLMCCLIYYFCVCVVSFNAHYHFIELITALS